MRLNWHVSTFYFLHLTKKAFLIDEREKYHQVYMLAGNRQLLCYICEKNNGSGNNFLDIIFVHICQVHGPTTEGENTFTSTNKKKQLQGNITKF